MIALARRPACSAGSVPRRRREGGKRRLLLALVLLGALTGAAPARPESAGKVLWQSDTGG